MEEIGMRVRVTVFLVEQIAATKSAEPVDAYDEAHDAVHEPMTEVEQVIMTACVQSSQSTPDLLRMLGYKSRTGNFKRVLSRLLDMGLLEMTNPQKPRARNQRYRSTHLGEEVLRKAGQDKECTQ